VVTFPDFAFFSRDFDFYHGVICLTEHPTPCP
jgi:hypothetical protein